MEGVEGPLMIRILFVDQDPTLLEALRLRLHPCRRFWDMDFTDSEEAALARLSQRPFDILVADIDPGVWNGADLLRIAEICYPTMKRIAFVGGYRFTHLESKRAHAFLPKPSDLNAINRLVNRLFPVSPTRLEAGVEPFL